MSEKLKPCPFCGKPPEMNVGADGYMVVCSNFDCMAKVNTWVYKQKWRAIAAWNRRAK